MYIDLPMPADARRQRLFFGPKDERLRRLRDRLGVRLTPRRDRLRVEGDGEAVEKAARLLGGLMEELDRAGDAPEGDGDAFARRLDMALEEAESGGDDAGVVTDRMRVAPRGPGQAEYLRALKRHELVFGLGPAGSGKTFLAVACAVEALRRGAVQRLVLTRPAVEAGERLGFLPGDWKDKVDPYLRPIYDALDLTLPRARLQRYTELGVVEVAPLAFMRGRTLAHAFVLLDEAQNATPAQMKMFLTRMGPGARCVVAGDPTQTDLPADAPGGSGLADAVRRLSGVPGVAVCRLGDADIVRHELVRAVVRAYEGDTSPAGENRP